MAWNTNKKYTVHPEEWAPGPEGFGRGFTSRSRTDLELDGFITRIRFLRYLENWIDRY